MLVYQSRNAPGWGRTRPHAFGYRDERSDDASASRVVDVVDVVDVTAARATVTRTTAVRGAADLDPARTPRALTLGATPSRGAR